MHRSAGIDYGARRIGVALSDERGSLAFPHVIVANDERALEAIADMVKREGVEKVVVGFSHTHEGKDNPIMEDVRRFVDALAHRAGVSVALHSEAFTTVQARRQFDTKEKIRAQPKKRPVDDSAAALILQSYLDTHAMSTTDEPKPTGDAPAPPKEAEADSPHHITIDDFKKVELRVGLIVSAERVPETDKLIRLMVDVGEEQPRQIISGIAAWYPEPSVLVGKKVPFVTNLAPRTMRGLESNGMILAAHDESGTFSLLPADDAIRPGTRLS